MMIFCLISLFCFVGFSAYFFYDFTGILLGVAQLAMGMGIGMCLPLMVFAYVNSATEKEKSGHVSRKT